tara:strand:+ start:56 stop:775 length:720 start_codon:yes stop_codon:yes gene_type:complete
MLRIFKKEDQTFGQFNGGEIVENKPIGFPHEAFVLKPFSNLFYWAHAIATKDSTIGLHPHKGFEILTYVLKGKIRHYDTKIEKWVSLKKGDVQLIQSGSGISHSEHLYDKSEIFQIWFDPDLSKSLNKEPQYKDYKEKEFENINGIKTIIGTSSDINIDSDVFMFEYDIKKEFYLELDKNRTHTFYLISGEIEIDKNIVTKDSFFIYSNVDNIKLICSEESILFHISVPNKLNYETYYK